MKKMIFMIVMILALIDAVYSQTAEIREMSGTVELQRAGASNWVAAKAGDRIETDTVISTGFKSTAILEVGNSTFTVKPITRLSIKELTAQNETETININLSTGRVRAEINPPAGGRANATVQSPIATASVRGTSFDMDPASITVLTGSVSFASAGSDRAVIVSAGQSTVIDTDSGAAINPMEVKEAERSLPSLPGQTGTVQTGSGSSPVVSRGQLRIEVQLIEE